jgi:hypothetical protein
LTSDVVAAPAAAAAAEVRWQLLVVDTLGINGKDKAFERVRLW